DIARLLDDIMMILISFEIIPPKYEVSEQFGFLSRSHGKTSPTLSLIAICREYMSTSPEIENNLKTGTGGSDYILAKKFIQVDSRSTE
ncbi:24407_t:CDS:2, partial [Dentiscutata erythropus]